MDDAAKDSSSPRRLRSQSLRASVSLWLISETFSPPNAATYDGSNVNFFVNGENVAKLPCAAGVDETSKTLKIAHSEMFGTNWDFPGAADDVRIYNRPLSDAEVKKNFASTGAAVEYSIEKLSLTWGKVKIR